MSHWLNWLTDAAFTLGGTPVSWAELLAFVISLWMVERNLKVHPLGWPLAILASALYMTVFARSGLYGEAGLQVMFVAVSLWGWWAWLRDRHADGSPRPPSAMDARARWVLALCVVVSWPLLGLALARGTDSTAPYADALLTVGSVAGQWLLGRKHVETWPVWLAVNLGSVALFAHKHLWLTAALYGVFAVLSVVGWRAWRRLAESPANRPAAAQAAKAPVK